MVATAIVGAGVLGAGASLYGANKQAGAANKATSTQAGMFQQAQQNLQPYMAQGGAAGTQLSSLLAPGGQLSQNFTPADYLANKDPGYQFQLQQGQNALQASQAGQNGVLAGSSLKDLISYNQGMAATGYQNAFDRWQSQNTNLYNRLMGVYTTGENAAAGVGNMGVQTGANMASTITGAGNAEAAGAVGAANAVGNSVNNGLGYYMFNQMMGSRGTMPVNSADPYGYQSGQDPIAAFAGS